MSDVSTTERVLFPELFRKQVVVEFDEMNVSSDGGAILLRAADKRLKLTERLAEPVFDRRDAGRVAHGLREVLAQRVFAIACGHPDANDAAVLARDPAHMLAVGRDPQDGGSLASQPTISRFENGVDSKDLYCMAEALADTVIERHRTRLRGKARRVTIDIDPTDDPTYGNQQLSLFNGFYDNWCYLPLLTFLTFDDEKDQFLVAAILRPGKAAPKVGSVGLLRRLLPRLREAFPEATFRVRLDGGFAAPDLLDYLESEPDVEYVVGFAKNPVLREIAKPLLSTARQRALESGKSEREYGEVRYRTRSWSHERRMIIKAEVTQLEGCELRENPRFLVTNMKQSPRFIYEKVYCMRGEIENRIKELQDGLHLGRTSCTRFLANQLRVLLTAAAYVLMQELRLRAARTSLARAQVNTLRDSLLKIAARVVVSVRRVVLHVPRSFPSAPDWRRISRELGATT